MTALRNDPADQPTSDTQCAAVGGAPNVQQAKARTIPSHVAPAVPNLPADQVVSDIQNGPVGGDLLPEARGQASCDAHKQAAPVLWDPILDTLAAALDDLEAVRIAQTNRLRILTATGPDSDGIARGFGLDNRHPAVATLETTLTLVATAEHKTQLALARTLRKHPLYPWIKAQAGLGEKQVARLLAVVGDPYWNGLHDRPRTVSELWAYCGLHVLPSSHSTSDTQERCAARATLPADQTATDAQMSSVGGDNCGGGDAGQGLRDTHSTSAGVAPARRRGERVNWNMTARSRIYVIAESCMKNRRSPYRKAYDEGRAKYADAVHPAECRQCGAKGKPAPAGSELRDGHKHARAMRLVMKAILRDLWIESRGIHDVT